MREEHARALFLLANIEVRSVHRLENQYWPPAYIDMIQKYPWWLMDTPYGYIVIGPRKRVISIEWSGTKVRRVLTKDNVTKDETLVHAWTTLKVLEYLVAFRNTIDGMEHPCITGIES